MEIRQFRYGWKVRGWERHLGFGFVFLMTGLDNRADLNPSRELYTNILKYFINKKILIIVGYDLKINDLEILKGFQKNIANLKFTRINMPCIIIFSRNNHTLACKNISNANRGRGTLHPRAYAPPKIRTDLL